VQVPDECAANLGQNPDVSTLSSGARITRYPLSIKLRYGAREAGTFVRPVNVAIGDEPGASALVVWTARAPVNSEPSQVHFGFVARGDPPVGHRIRLRSLDGSPFHVLSVDRSPYLEIRQPEGADFPSGADKFHALELVFELPPGESSPFLSGSVRIRIDRDDCPEVHLPWSAFLRSPEIRTPGTATTASAISQPASERTSR
jgi:hypothetical protein